eukprot:246685-Amphidinium_carterae.1
MLACERLQGQGVIVTDCKGAAVVANKLKLGLRKPRGRHSRVEHRILAAIGDIEVHWMRSHQTAQQAEAAGLPAAYLTGNAEADLLAGSAVQDVPPVPSDLGLFRRAAAAARSFWSLFASACPKEHLVEEDQVSQGRQPSFSRVAQIFAHSATGTSSVPRKSSFYTHLVVEDESSPMLEEEAFRAERHSAGSLEAVSSPLDVRADDEMDQRVPVDRVDQMA